MKPTLGVGLTRSRIGIDRLTLVDAGLLAALVILLVLFSHSFVFDAPPLEDAAMLMRYGQNLANGHGIVWNIGEKPVDGATDFLLTVVVAAVVKIGFTVERAVVLIGLASHALTTLVIYFGARGLSKAHAGAAFASAAFFALGPGLDYVSLGFGTPFFALLSAVTWCCAIKSADLRSTFRIFVAFALSGLTLGLIRPEGVILAGLMLLATVYARGLRQSYLLIGCFCIVFGVLGGAYFLWRWNYFGYPLPNPFYKKGGGRFYPHSLGASVKNVLVLTLPFILAFPFGFRSSKTARATMFALIPIAGFTLAWVLLSNEMNWLMRFQYAIVPLVLISWPTATHGLAKDFGVEPAKLGARKIGVAAIVAAVGLSLCLGFQQQSYRGTVTNSRFDNTYRIAELLSQYRGRAYTIATTEAGLVPLYSGWRAIDAYGLNDQWIAHNGGVSVPYLEEHKPEVVMIHADFAPQERPPLSSLSGDAFGLRNWAKMVGTLFQYVEANDYELAAAYGYSWQSVYYYYVRRDFADSQAIITQIRDLRPELQDIKTRDFSLLQRIQE